MLKPKTPWHEEKQSYVKLSLSRALSATPGASVLEGESGRAPPDWLCPRRSPAQGPFQRFSVASWQMTFPQRRGSGGGASSSFGGYAEFSLQGKKEGGGSERLVWKKAIDEKVFVWFRTLCAVWTKWPPTKLWIREFERTGLREKNWVAEKGSNVKKATLVLYVRSMNRKPHRSYADRGAIGAGWNSNHRVSFYWVAFST